jgi:AraC-like DNA-binding protein
MTNRKLLSIGGGAALLGAVLVGGIVTANAQDSGTGSSTQSMPADKQANRDAYLEKLAGKLGISVDALKEAIKSTNLEILDQKVADGTITQAQADEIRSRIESGDTWFGAGGGGMGRHGGGHGPGMAAGRDEIASFLGIDEATLDQGLKDGKSLATIAQEAGKSRDELKAFLTDQATQHINQEVADGRMTQEQADQKLANLSSRLDQMIDGQFMGGPGGHAHSHPDTNGDGARFAPARRMAGPGTF